MEKSSERRSRRIGGFRKGGGALVPRKAIQHHLEGLCTLGGEGPRKHQKRVPGETLLRDAATPIESVDSATKNKFLKKESYDSLCNFRGGVVLTKKKPRLAKI